MPMVKSCGGLVVDSNDGHDGLYGIDEKHEVIDSLKMLLLVPFLSKEKVICIFSFQNGGRITHHLLCQLSPFYSAEIGCIKICVSMYLWTCDHRRQTEFLNIRMLV